VKVVVAASAPVLALPLVGSLPDQPPEAVQPVALLEDQLSVAADPLLTVAGVTVRLAPGEVTAAGPAVGESEALPPPQPLSSPASVEQSRTPKRPAR
jgi:hypothetical protein